MSPTDRRCCPACADGWHARCLKPRHAGDQAGEPIERCCDGLLVTRRRPPLWTS